MKLGFMLGRDISFDKAATRREENHGVVEVGLRH